MAINIPEHMQGKVQHALEKAVSDAKLFPAPGHQAMEPEGIDAGSWYGDIFRGIYDAPFPVGGKLGDWIPGMNVAEGLNRGAQGLAEGNYGSAGLDIGASILDGLDPSPIPWSGLAGVGMTAWHGSPHKWNKVDLGKVGTGEGAQAYGHGFYSAEDMGVGEQYQKALQRSQIEINGTPVFNQSGGAIDRDKLTSALEEATGADERTANTLARFVDNGGDFSKEGALAALDKQVERYGYEGYDKAAEQLTSYRPYLEKIESIKNSPSGHLYELDINDDIIDKMLDWDAPLSESMLENLNNITGDRRIFREGMNGEKAYQQVQDYGARRGFWDKSRDKGFDPYAMESDPRPGLASEFLNNNGIPGIKYWDGSSRTAGEGTRNYVNFNADDIKAISRNGVPIHELDTLTRGYHGSDIEGLTALDPSYANTAKHFYASPNADDAGQYGKSLYEVDISGRMGDFTPEVRGVNETLAMQRAFDAYELGDDFDGFDDFLEAFDSGDMYQRFASSRVQDDVIDALLAQGYDSLKIPDAGFGGNMSESFVFGNPELAKLRKINK